MDANDHHRDGWALTISCDECSMQCTSACADCVVTYLLGDEHDQAVADHGAQPLVLDQEQARVVALFGAAGLVPELRYRRVS